MGEGRTVQNVKVMRTARYRLREGENQAEVRVLVKCGEVF